MNQWRLLKRAQVKMVENTPMYKNEPNEGQIDQQRLPINKMNNILDILDIDILDILDILDIDILDNQV